MSSSSIILYDIPSQGRKHCWSPNPWKTRLALNYKNLPYTTEFTEYPDIATKLSSFGIPPNETGTAYTIPAVKFSDGTYVMDSMAIAKALEERYPSPSLHIDAPKLQRLPALLLPIVEALRPIWMPKVPRNILRDASVPYFYRTRSEQVSQDLDEYSKEKGGEHCWTEAGPHIAKLSDFVAENTEGVFVEGTTVSYSDFVIAGFLRFHKCNEEQLFNRIVAGHQPLLELYKACEPWMLRDD